MHDRKFMKIVFRGTRNEPAVLYSRIARRVDVDYMKPATSISTLILIPGASWETAAMAHAPPRRRSSD